MLDLSLLPSPITYYSRYFTIKSSKAKVLVKCCLPDHTDNSPSLSLELTTGCFNCFGCGASGGDILDFHKLKHGLSTTEAAKDLGAWVSTQNESPDAIAARKERIAQAEKTREAQKQRAEQQELKDAQAFKPVINAIMQSLSDSTASQTPYIVSKGLGINNLYAMPSEALQGFKDPLNTAHTLGYGLQGLLTIAPIISLEGELVALQVFDGMANDKGKFARRYIGRPVCFGGYYCIGDLANASLVLICESVNDALTLFEATGYPSLAAGSSAQLSAAAVAVHTRYPLASIVLCGDNDTNGNGQKAARKAAIAVNGAVAIPTDYKDINDLYQAQGKQAVKAFIDSNINNKEPLPLQADNRVC